MTNTAYFRLKQFSESEIYRDVQLSYAVHAGIYAVWEICIRRSN
jgi:hypothetical protein